MKAAWVLGEGFGAPKAEGDDGTSKFIIINPPAGNRFYRLSRYAQSSLKSAALTPAAES